MKSIRGIFRRERSPAYLGLRAVTAVFAPSARIVRQDDTPVEPKPRSARSEPGRVLAGTNLAST